MPRRSSLRSTLVAASILNISSTILAQLLKIYRTGTSPVQPTALNPLGLDFKAVLVFWTWCLIATPPNVKWQEYLERTFPPRKRIDTQGKRDEKALDAGQTARNWPNVFKMFIADQTLGTWVNNVAFLFGIALLRGQGVQAGIENVQTNFLPVQLAAYRLWPLVSFIQFTLVPVDKRILVGNVVGLVWGILLVLMVSPSGGKVKA